jgi:hypothetical protein
MWRFRMKLSLRDLAEILLLRGLVFSREASRDWEARLAPLLTDALRQRRKGKAGRNWYVKETLPAQLKIEEPQKTSECFLAWCINAANSYSSLLHFERGRRSKPAGGLTARRFTLNHEMCTQKNEEPNCACRVTIAPLSARVTRHSRRRRDTAVPHRSWHARVSDCGVESDRTA